MDDEELYQLRHGDDDFVSLQILDKTRKQLHFLHPHHHHHNSQEEGEKKKHNTTTSQVFDESQISRLCDAIRERLARHANEEFILAVVQLLVELIHSFTSPVEVVEGEGGGGRQKAATPKVNNNTLRLSASVAESTASLLPALVGQLGGGERVRRAVSVLFSAILKQQLQQGGEGEDEEENDGDENDQFSRVDRTRSTHKRASSHSAMTTITTMITDSLISYGIQSSDDIVSKNALVLCGDLCRMTTMSSSSSQQEQEQQYHHNHNALLLDYGALVNSASSRLFEAAISLATSIEDADTENNSKIAQSGGRILTKNSITTNQQHTAEDDNAQNLRNLIAAAQKTLGRIKAADPTHFQDYLKSLDPDIKEEIFSAVNMNAINHHYSSASASTTTTMTAISPPTSKTNHVLNENNYNTNSASFSSVSSSPVRTSGFSRGMTPGTGADTTTSTTTNNNNSSNITNGSSNPRRRTSAATTNSSHNSIGGGSSSIHLNSNNSASTAILRAVSPLAATAAAMSLVYGDTMMMMPPPSQTRTTTMTSSSSHSRFSPPLTATNSHNNNRPLTGTSTMTDERTSDSRAGGGIIAATMLSPSALQTLLQNNTSSYASRTNRTATIAAMGNATTTTTTRSIIVDGDFTSPSSPPRSSSQQEGKGHLFSSPPESKRTTSSHNLAPFSPVSPDTSNSVRGSSNNNNMKPNSMSSPSSSSSSTSLPASTETAAAADRAAAAEALLSRLLALFPSASSPSPSPSVILALSGFRGDPLRDLLVLATDLAADSSIRVCVVGMGIIDRSLLLSTIAAMKEQEQDNRSNSKGGGGGGGGGGHLVRPNLYSASTFNNDDNADGYSRSSSSDRNQNQNQLKWIHEIWNVLSDRLGDGKALVRHAAMKAASSLLEACGTRASLPPVLSLLRNAKNKNAREAGLRLCIHALLLSGRTMEKFDNTATTTNSTDSNAKIKKKNVTSPASIASVDIVNNKMHLTQEQVGELISASSPLLSDAAVKVASASLEFFAATNTYLSGFDPAKGGLGKVSLPLSLAMQDAGVAVGSPEWLALSDRIEYMPSAVPRINPVTGYLELPAEVAQDPLMLSPSFASSMAPSASSSSAAVQMLQKQISSSSSATRIIGLSPSKAAINSSNNNDNNYNNNAANSLTPVTTLNMPRLESRNVITGSGGRTGGDRRGDDNDGSSSSSSSRMLNNYDILLKEGSGRGARTTPLSVESMSIQSTPLREEGGNGDGYASRASWTRRSSSNNDRGESDAEEKESEEPESLRHAHTSFAGTLTRALQEKQQAKSSQKQQQHVLGRLPAASSPSKVLAESPYHDLAHGGTSTNYNSGGSGKIVHKSPSSPSKSRTSAATTISSVNASGEKGQNTKRSSRRGDVDDENEDDTVDHYDEENQGGKRSENESDGYDEHNSSKSNRRSHDVDSLVDSTLHAQLPRAGGYAARHLAASSQQHQQQHRQQQQQQQQQQQPIAATAKRTGAFSDSALTRTKARAAALAADGAGIASALTFQDDSMIGVLPSSSTNMAMTGNNNRNNNNVSNRTQNVNAKSPQKMNAPQLLRISASSSSLLSSSSSSRGAAVEGMHSGSATSPILTPTSVVEGEYSSNNNDAAEAVVRGKLDLLKRRSTSTRQASRRTASASGTSTTTNNDTSNVSNNSFTSQQDAKEEEDTSMNTPTTNININNNSSSSSSNTANRGRVLRHGAVSAKPTIGNGNNNSSSQEKIRQQQELSDSKYEEFEEETGAFRGNNGKRLQGADQTDQTHTYPTTLKKNQSFDENAIQGSKNHSTATGSGGRTRLQGLPPQPSSGNSTMSGGNGAYLQYNRNSAGSTEPELSHNNENGSGNAAVNTNNNKNRANVNTNAGRFPAKSYDSVALSEEFGWDPYAGQPPSPTKSSRRWNSTSTEGNTFPTSASFDSQHQQQQQQQQQYSPSNFTNNGMTDSAAAAGAVVPVRRIKALSGGVLRSSTSSLRTNGTINSMKNGSVIAADGIVNQYSFEVQSPPTAMSSSSQKSHLPPLNTHTISPINGDNTTTTTTTATSNNNTTTGRGIRGGNHSASRSDDITMADEGVGSSSSSHHGLLTPLGTPRGGSGSGSSVQYPFPFTSTNAATTTATGSGADTGGSGRLSETSDDGFGSGDGMRSQTSVPSSSTTSTATVVPSLGPLRLLTSRMARSGGARSGGSSAGRGAVLYGVDAGGGGSARGGDNLSGNLNGGVGGESGRYPSDDGSSPLSSSGEGGISTERVVVGFTSSLNGGKQSLSNNAETGPREERPIRPMANAAAFYRTLAAQGDDAGTTSFALTAGFVSPVDTNLDMDDPTTTGSSSVTTTNNAYSSGIIKSSNSGLSPSPPPRLLHGALKSAGSRSTGALSPIRPRPQQHQPPTYVSVNSKAEFDDVANIFASHVGGENHHHHNVINNVAAVPGHDIDIHSNSNFNDDAGSVGSTGPYGGGANSDALSVATSGSAASYSVMSSSSAGGIISHNQHRGGNRAASTGRLREGMGGGGKNRGYSAEDRNNGVNSGAPSAPDVMNESGTTALNISTSSALSGVPSGAPNTEKLYIPTSQLSPLIPSSSTSSTTTSSSSAIDSIMRSVLVDLASGDWELQFEACNTIRRAATHHADMVFLSSSSSSGSSLLHSCVKGITPLCDSLRSSISKIALMTLADLFTGLGRAIDGDIDAVLPGLIRRSADTNEFILVAAEDALVGMIFNCGETRVLSALLSTAGHKSINVRLKTAIWLDRAVDRVGSRMCGNRDLEKIVIIAAKYMEEGSPETRYAGTRILQKLLRVGAIDERFLSRALPDRQLARLRENILSKPAQEDPMPLGVATAGVYGGGLRVNIDSYASDGDGSYQNNTSSSLANGSQSPSHVSTGRSSSRRHRQAAMGSPKTRTNTASADISRGRVNTTMMDESIVVDEGRGGGEETSNDAYYTANGSNTILSTDSSSITSVRRRVGTSAGVLRSANSGRGGIAAGNDNQQNGNNEQNIMTTTDGASGSVATTTGGAGGGGMAAVRAKSRLAGRGQSANHNGHNASSSSSDDASNTGPSVSSLVAEVLGRVSSSDWNVRVAALGDLTELITREHSMGTAGAITSPVSAVAVADQLAQRLTDGHKKVVLAAAQATEAIVGKLRRGDVVDSIVPVLLPRLSSCLLSDQRAVSTSASAALDRLLTSADASTLVAPISALIRHGNSKLKGPMLEKLATIIPAAAARKGPSSLMKSVLPMVFELLDDAKSDVKTGIGDVLVKVGDCVGAEAVLDAARTSSVTETQMEKLRRILKGGGGGGSGGEKMRR